MLTYVVDRVRDFLDILLNTEDVKTVDLIPQDLEDVLDSLGLTYRFLENNDFLQMAAVKSGDKTLIFCLDRTTPRPVFWISSRTSLNRHILARYGGEN